MGARESMPAPGLSHERFSRRPSNQEVPATRTVDGPTGAAVVQLDPERRRRRCGHRSRHLNQPHIVGADPDGGPGEGPGVRICGDTAEISAQEAHGG